MILCDVVVWSLVQRFLMTRASCRIKRTTKIEEKRGAVTVLKRHFLENSKYFLFHVDQPQALHTFQNLPQNLNRLLFVETTEPLNLFLLSAKLDSESVGLLINGSVVM